MELFGIVMHGALVWIFIAVIFAVIEALTMGLTTIWFSAGAVCAAVVSMLHAHMLMQVIVFLVVSVVLLYFTKPLAEKKLRIGQEKTNADALIGRKGLVVAEIAPYQTGLVKVDGQVWTAIGMTNDTHIENGTEVTITKIQGVKLIVIAE
ncbi:NfeD family protein [Sinanaerobacter sp. ZZT-01]|uniref:NfeD family protein n=1 Tax=Sinanaerobacter sp. ZZT-01 TaxID=3111540 RepID=UPI002D79B8C9|nr:NfeD family protein [Sinanaerobacter sp. ZZT-01]WRR93242.1 NfeD family protein [Sinanaerobacter sp. ZZT-01]